MLAEMGAQFSFEIHVQGGAPELRCQRFATALPMDSPKESCYPSFAMTSGESGSKSEVLQGTLDLMILKTLQALGPLHGFGIARRLEQVSEDVLRLNEGTVYTSLLRLHQSGWISTEWGVSENNRKARYYAITRSGLRQLARETENWERIAGVIGRVLQLAAGKQR